MQKRRGFLLSVVTGVVAMALVVGSVIADELLGVLTKVDVDAKKITVVEKGTDKEIVLKTTGDTEWITKKGTTKLDSEGLEKLDGLVKKIQDAGKKGLTAKVYHEKGVASKLETKFGKGKKAAAQ
jgi:hypothetical protein